jgi:diguanylate cyclase (GGDEF)-like protein/PAS domain S-box-containing protein
LESAFNAAPIGLCVLDLDFRYITANRCFLSMYGLTQDQVIGRFVREALPGIAPQLEAHLRDALESDTIVEREIAFSHANPETGQLEELIYLRTAQPVRDENGKVIGLSVGLLDITQRKRLDHALKESEEDLRYTVELTPHIPWTADPAGELTSMSSRWNAVTGRKPEIVLLKDWAMVLHPDDRAATLDLWSTSVRTGQPYDAEYRVRVADGSWRWFRARAYPRLKPSGEIMRWYGTVEDIHERKVTGLQLQEATGELARRALEDHLTGLPNRRRFDKVLGHEIERASRTKRPLGLIMLDVDHFKHYNDTCGHLAGDACLKAVACALEAVIRRPADLAARYGGEEFAIILPETSREGACEIAQRAVSAVRALNLERIDKRIRKVTISAGVAVFEPGPNFSQHIRPSELIDAADIALYQAKAAGRDRVTPAAAPAAPGTASI